MENNINNEIKKIISNTDLTQEEKTRLIQNIMSGKFANNSKNNTNNSTNNINLNVCDKYNFNKYPNHLKFIKEQYYKLKENTKNNIQKDTQDTTQDNTQNIIYNNCEHYNRNCYIVSDCCLKVYNCRLCHDDNENHEINRFNTKYIICKNCDLVQKVNDKCIGCNITFAKYYCEKCVLYMDNTEAYHCDKCKICRIGDKNKYKHCDECNMCFNIDYINEHKCSNVYKSNCSICFENIFASRSEATKLRCGHAFHIKCINEHFKNDYKCPLCKKSAYSMEHKWDELNTLCDLYPTPDEYKNWKLKVYCNDCEQQTITPFHLLFIKCQNCNGYNTQNVEIYKNNEIENDNNEDNENNNDDTVSSITDTYTSESSVSSLYNSISSLDNIITDDES